MARGVARWTGKGNAAMYVSNALTEWCTSCTFTTIHNVCVLVLTLDTGPENRLQLQSLLMAHPTIPIINLLPVE